MEYYGLVLCEFDGPDAREEWIIRDYTTSAVALLSSNKTQQSDQSHGGEDDAEIPFPLEPEHLPADAAVNFNRLCKDYGFDLEQMESESPDPSPPPPANPDLPIPPIAGNSSTAESAVAAKKKVEVASVEPKWLGWTEIIHCSEKS